MPPCLTLDTLTVPASMSGISFSVAPLSASWCGSADIFCHPFALILYDRTGLVGHESPVSLGVFSRASFAIQPRPRLRTLLDGAGPQAHGVAGM
eukprot:scaffold3523_cov34-Phaeocystis_antarctica.AAC.2